MRTKKKLLCSVISAQRVSNPFLSTACALALVPVCSIAVNAQAPSAGQLEEVVVTATRRAESIQDVPMSITAISGEDFADDNFTEFSDIAQLTSGLGLNQTSQGPEPSLRGVQSVTISGGPPAVDIYWNDAPVNATFAFQALYDVQQIEVLRGPQGTLRGNTAPSGAITIATQRPDLSEMGGYIRGDLANQEQDELGYYSEAGVSIPLVEDQLAVRLAGLLQRDDNNGTQNHITNDDSEGDIASGRLSVLYQPTDRFEVFTSYQYLDNQTDFLARVDGAGLGYNGPAIDGGDNRAVQEQTQKSGQITQFGDLHAQYEFDPASLHYILGWRKSNLEIDTGDEERDKGNSILNLGRLPNSFNQIPVETWSHELRLESPGGEFLDWVVGYFRDTNHVDVTQYYPQIGLPGAFGDPDDPATGNPTTGPLNERYLAYTRLDLGGGDDSIWNDEPGSQSVFANMTFNLDTGTHIRSGLRWIWTKTDNNFVLNISDSWIAVPVPIPTSLCSTVVPVPGAIASPVYPTSCDIPFDAIAVADQHIQQNFDEPVYEFSVTQDLTDDWMAYASFAHNWRAGGLTQGNVPLQYVTADPEKSNNYEIGTKASLFEQRVLVTFAAFFQEFDNYNATTSQIPFLAAGDSVMDAFSITYNGDAEVQGLETDVQALITDNWTANLGASYAKSNFKDAEVPCRDSNFDGQPDTGTPTAEDFIAAGVNVATCNTTGPINGLPKWSANLRTEYVVPMQAGEFYGRVLYNWQSQGEIMSANEPIESYGVFNFYAGVRGLQNSALDVGLYVKNAFDTTRRIDQGSELNFLGVASGYREVWYTEGREFGLSVRYTFGEG